MSEYVTAIIFLSGNHNPSHSLHNQQTSIMTMTMTTFNRFSLLLVLLASLSEQSVVSSFVPPSTPSSTTTTTTTSSSLSTRVSSWRVSSSFLSAKINKNKKKQKGPGTASGAGGFGGFGDPAASTSNKKVRTLTGFSGSGTKPLRQAANTFDALVKKYGKESVADIYVKSPANDPDLMWFVGKVARCIVEEDLDGTTIPTEEEAIISQKRLILEYAKRELRPQNLGGPFSEGLELWLAPGDSEMDCVQNKVRELCTEGVLVCLVWVCVFVHCPVFPLLCWSHTFLVFFLSSP